MTTPQDPRQQFARTRPADVGPGPDEEHRQEGEYRFGPGVPTLTDTLTDTADDRVARAWHGTVAPRRRRRGRLLGGWLLPAVALIAVLAYLGWQRYAPGLAVTGVTVRTDPAGPACDGAATVTGTLHTNGRTGTVDYRWKRSDGTVSGTLHQRVARDARQTDVVLRWAFDGRGTLRATATLEVLSPDPVTASVTFTYACP
jgi:hypothetical protein